MFARAWIKIIGFLLFAILLCMIPAEAQASETVIFAFMYWGIGFSQFLPLLVLCSKRMEGRCLIASLAYLLLVGAAWKYVVLAPLLPEHALQFSEPEWFARTLFRKREYLLSEFGPEDGLLLFDILTFYVPLLLPPLIAGAIYAAFKKPPLPDAKQSSQPA